MHAFCPQNYANPLKISLSRVLPLPKSIFYAACVSLLCATVSAQPATATLRTLVIDPGHGGKDPGAVSKKHKEKDIVLSVAKKLRDSLAVALPDLFVVLTRNKDTFIELHHRAELAQSYNADLFLSIHVNADESHIGCCTESFVMGINEDEARDAAYIRENEVVLFEDNYTEMYGGFKPRSPEGKIFFSLLKNAYRTESLQLAHLIENEFTVTTQRKSRGVKQEPFLVLWQSGVPAVLTEIGFISNAHDEPFISSEEGQCQIAGCLCRAIVAYNNRLR